MKSEKYTHVKFLIDYRRLSYGSLDVWSGCQGAIFGKPHESRKSSRIRLYFIINIITPSFRAKHLSLTKINNMLPVYRTRSMNWTSCNEFKARSNEWKSGKGVKDSGDYVKCSVIFVSTLPRDVIDWRDNFLKIIAYDCVRMLSSVVMSFWNIEIFW